MNKLFSKIAALSVGLAMAVGVGVALGHESAREVRADDELVYTLTPASGTNNSYTGNCDIEISGITWNLTGNSTVQPWRIGGKSLSGVDRALYSKTVMSDNVSKIEVTHGSASNITVNSMTLIVATDADFSSVVSTLTPTFAASSTVTIERPTDKSWENCYYKFVYNVTVSGSSNKFLQFTEAKFYKESGDPTQDTLVVKLNDATESPLTLDYSPTGSWLFYANDKDGNDIDSEWSSSDESVFTVSENGNNVAVVVPHNPGTANLVASADGFNDGVFVLTVNAGTLESIEVTGSMSKTSYYVGEAWSPAGLVATGTYETGYVGDITSEVEWSYSPAAPATSVTSVVATATVGTVSDNSSAQTVTVSKTNQIQALYGLASGASVDVYGYYVGFLDGTGPVIMDGEYGVVIYNSSADVSGYTAGTTILHVTGSISIYKGLYEIGSATIEEATSVPEEKVPSTPVVYATKGGETADYASRLTTVTGTATVTSGSFDSDAGTADIKMNFTVGAQTIQVFYKKAAQTADAEAFAAMKAAVTDSTEITIKGFTGWYNGFQVQMNGYVPAAEGYTAEQFAQDLLDQTDAVCAGWKEGDDNHDALVAIWSNLAAADKYPSLPSDQKTILAEAERDEEGTVIEQAMARYDFLTGKYELSNFINGRTPIQSNYNFAPAFENNNSYIIIIVISAVSVMSFGLALFLRKRKSK